MCFAVLEVRYRNKTEPDGLVSIADEETYNKRLDDLKKLDTVERITVFKPAHTHQRVSSWDTTDHVQTYELPKV